MKKLISNLIKSTKFGNRKYYQIKKLLGRYRVPDQSFPELISIEISSKCNLACTHCPPHMKEYKEQVREHNHIDYDLFLKLMDEIDLHGNRHIALHKDGEPLLHPRVNEILQRVKKNRQHEVYLATNAHLLNEDKINSLLENKIDIINFSIGAASESFYTKVRGKGYDKVITNIRNFLSKVSESGWKPKVFVQIIDLPEHSEMRKEIDAFRKFWKDYDVEVTVWNKLTWGEFDNQKFKYRYPCYSLWHSFNINSNGIVTTCCMDWKQELEIGNAFEQSISEIWNGDKLRDLRTQHVQGKENEINACRICNYWQWQPMLLDYPL